MMDIFKGIKQIQEHYGKEAQTKKCIEELAELIQALCKGNLDNIIEETADVLIMVNQIVSLYGIEEEIETTMEKKVERTIRVIADECLDKLLEKESNTFSNMQADTLDFNNFQNHIEKLQYRIDNDVPFKKEEYFLHDEHAIKTIEELNKLLEKGYKI